MANEEQQQLLCATNARCRHLNNMIVTATGKDIGKIHTKYSRNLTQLNPIDEDEHIILTQGAPVIFLIKTEVTNPKNKAKIVIRTGVTGKVAGWRGTKQIDTVFIKVGGYPDPFPVRMCAIEEKGKTHWGVPIRKIILDTAFQLTPAMFYTGVPVESENLMIYSSHITEPERIVILRPIYTLTPRLAP